MVYLHHLRHTNNFKRYMVQKKIGYIELMTGLTVLIKHYLVRHMIHRIMQRYIILIQQI